MLLPQPAQSVTSGSASITVTTCWPVSSSCSCCSTLRSPPARRCRNGSLCRRCRNGRKLVLIRSWWCCLRMVSWYLSPYLSQSRRMIKMDSAAGTGLFRLVRSAAFNLLCQLHYPAAELPHLLRRYPCHLRFQVYLQPFFNKQFCSRLSTSPGLRPRGGGN